MFIGSMFIFAIMFTGSISVFIIFDNYFWEYGWMRGICKCKVVNAIFLLNT